ncbi:MAG: hypothetical protein C0391_01725 [Anaerolinea sp.]|nr:hypothetical protein [Anaerolinea sp.]
MSGITCTQCQRENPEDALFCRFCNEPLGSQPSEQPLPDETTVDTAGSDQEPIPDWLAAIRDRKQKESPPVPNAEPAKDDSTLETVLSSLGGGKQKNNMLPISNEEGQPATSDARQAEWLSNIRSKISDGKPPDGEMPAVGGEAGQTLQQADEVEEIGEPVSASNINQPAAEAEDALDGLANTDKDDPMLQEGATIPECQPGLEVTIDETAEKIDSGQIEPKSGFPGKDAESRSDSEETGEMPVDLPGRHLRAGEQQSQSPELVDALEDIPGILPGQEIKYHPPRQTTAQSPSDSTTARISMFETTLLAEKEEHGSPLYKRSRSSFIVRWVIAALLLGLISLVQLSNAAPSRLPQSIPVEIVDFYTSISGVRAGANVLLILDYEPAYAGEVETAASAGIRLLADKQASFFTVSTSAHNLFLADKLLTAVNATGTDLEVPFLGTDRFTVLGYLPGGQSGMQGLLRDFKGSLPLGLNLSRTTDIPGLSTIHNLNSFDGILILTDNPDTARTWVEQIQPLLTSPQLWMVVSSQAVPLVRPYIRSGQIDGLIGGMYGAASFEQVLREPGPATQLWNGYYYALVFSLFIMATAGILNYLGFSILKTHRGESS